MLLVHLLLSAFFFLFYVFSIIRFW
jgi:hypothetical protein